MRTRFIDSIFPNSRFVDWLFPGRVARRRLRELHDVLSDLCPPLTPFYTLADRAKHAGPDEREG